MQQHEEALDAHEQQHRTEETIPIERRCDFVGSVYCFSVYIILDHMSSCEEELAKPGSWEFYLNIGLAAGCVVLAALAAGLTIGLVAIEPFRLQILLETQEEDCTSARQVRELRAEKKYAQTILPVVVRHHLLLVTLLLMNSVANEALPLFLDEVVPTPIAVLLSVTFVLLFGEIIPSAIFTGPHQLMIASKLAPVVKVFMFLLFPIAFPISKVLDYLLGEDHSDKYTKAELRALVKLHAHECKGSKKKGIGPRRNTDIDPIQLQAKLELAGVDVKTAHMAAAATTVAQIAIEEEEHEFIHGRSLDAVNYVAGVRDRSGSVASTEAGLELDEISIMQGALDLKDTAAQEKMIPIARVYMLSADDVLSENKLADIVACGHSRIPVYDGERTNIRGLLLVKKLIVLNPTDRRTIRSLFVRPPLFIKPSTSLLDLLNRFQEGGSHLAVVTSNPRSVVESLRADVPFPDELEVLGIVTIEDVMETLIKEQIADETDFSGLKQKLLTQQRGKRLKQLALKQMNKRKLAASGSAALASAKNRTAAFQNPSSYGSIPSPTTPLLHQV